MTRHRLAILFCEIAICVAAAAPLGLAAEKAVKPDIVGGLVIDEERKSPKEIKSITVKPDGEETPIKYLIDKDLNQKSTAALAGIFSVGRVRLTYRLEGETGYLTNIDKITGKPNGTVVGEILQTHGWWVEVKPKDGVPEGYACTDPKEKWQATEAQIKALEKGDVVAIKFVTDGERHRIVQLDKREKAK